MHGHQVLHFGCPAQAILTSSGQKAGRWSSIQIVFLACFHSTFQYSIHYALSGLKISKACPPPPVPVVTWQLSLEFDTLALQN